VVGRPVRTQPNASAQVVDRVVAVGADVVGGEHAASTSRRGSVVQASRPIEQRPRELETVLRCVAEGAGLQDVDLRPQVPGVLRGPGSPDGSSSRAPRSRRISRTPSPSWRSRAAPSSRSWPAAAATAPRQGSGASTRLGRLSSMTVR